MSMPSSRLEVATTAGSRPALSSSSTRARCSLETEPWWARAITGGAPRAAPEPPISRAGACASGGGVPAGPLQGDLVQPVAEPLGEAAGVGEDDGRAVGLDEVDDALLDVRPDGGFPLRVLGTGGAGRGGGGQVVEVRDGDYHGEVELLGGGRLDHLGAAPGAEEAGHLLDRADGGGQADPAGRAVEQLVQPLQGEGEVGAALGAG